jgi:hypothetical protein
MLSLFSFLWAKEATDQYAQEIGGIASAEIRNDNYPNDSNKFQTYLVNINPFYHFYCLKYLYVGPAIEYNYNEVKQFNVYDIKSNIIGLGLDIGIAISNKSNFIPFLQGNYAFGIFSSTDLTNTSSINNKRITNEYTNQIAFDLGIKIIIRRNISINVSTGYTYLNTNGTFDYTDQDLNSRQKIENQSNYFRIINLGLSGLIF